AGDRAAGLPLDDHLLELVDILQPALDVYRQLELDTFVVGRAADHPGRDLLVLASHGGDHVLGTDAAFGHSSRIEPEPHGVVPGAEQLHAADAGNFRQLVPDVENGVV